MNHLVIRSWRQYLEQPALCAGAAVQADADVTRNDEELLSLILDEALKGVDIAARFPNFFQKLLVNTELRKTFLDSLELLEADGNGTLTPLPEEARPPTFLYQQGQALVEAAIIFPILFLVILGTIDIVFVMVDHFALTRVAREVARDAAYLGGYDAEVEVALVEELEQARIERDEVTFEVMVYHYNTASGDFQLKPDCQLDGGLYLCRAGFGHDERVRVRLRKEWTFSAFGLLRVAHGTHDITQGSRGWRSE
jgi:hypothetical protein